MIAIIIAVNIRCVHVQIKEVLLLTLHAYTCFNER